MNLFLPPLTIRCRLTEGPIALSIPYWLLLGILLFSLVLNVIAGLISVSGVLSQPIAYIAKGGKQLNVCSKTMTNSYSFMSCL